MQPTLREFSGEADIQAMMALARASFADNLHVVDLPYRLSSWALDDAANVGLWVDATGRLLAWAVMQKPWMAIDYAYHPDVDPGLHRQILAWADHRAQELYNSPDACSSWYVTTLAHQIDRIRDLEQAGFACQANVGADSWSQVLMQRSSEMPLADYTLPPGFAIRPLAGLGEVEGYVELHRAVFRTRNMTVAWRARTLCRREYVPDLDMVAVAPDGRLAAFCIGWLDVGEPTRGQIEPLGVASDWRHLGLGYAILAETLRRLHQHGATQVYVETDNYRNAALELYESAGFRVIQDVLVYRRDYLKEI